MGFSAYFSVFYFLVCIPVLCPFPPPWLSKLVSYFVNLKKWDSDFLIRSVGFSVFYFIHSALSLIFSSLWFLLACFFFFHLSWKQPPEFIVYIRIQSWFYTYLGFGQMHDNLLKKETATHSSTLAWRIPWTEEPGGLQSMGSQRVGHDWATNTHTHTHTHTRWPISTSITSYRLVSLI